MTFRFNTWTPRNAGPDKVRIYINGGNRPKLYLNREKDGSIRVGSPTIDAPKITKVPNGYTKRTKDYAEARKALASLGLSSDDNFDLILDHAEGRKVIPEIIEDDEDA